MSEHRADYSAAPATIVELESLKYRGDKSALSEALPSYKVLSMDISITTNVRDLLKFLARAALFIASYGAGLVNMLLLPPNASIIQVNTSWVIMGMIASLSWPSYVNSATSA